MDKISITIIAILVFMLSVTSTGLLVQTARLGHSMEECRQYREQLEFAENRESEVRAAISRTSLILSETTTSVAELREKLKEVENSYNYMWHLFYDDDNNVSDREE